MKKLLLFLLIATTAQADTECDCIKKCLTNPAPTPTPGGSGLAKVCPGGIKPTKPVADNVKPPVLWKPEAEGMTDGRKGKPAFLGYTNKFDNKPSLRLYDKNGTERGTVGLYGSFESGNRYYSAHRNGTGETASQLKSKGVQYVEGEDGKCYGPFDPTQRTGGY